MQIMLFCHSRADGNDTRGHNNSIQISFSFGNFADYYSDMTLEQSVRHTLRTPGRRDFNEIQFTLQLAYGGGTTVS